MRLIDADACPALFDVEFEATKRLILDGEKHLDNLAEGFMEAHNVIRSMPTIDATPVVHGRWESHLLPMAWKCSVCGRRMGYNAWKYKYMNYCPMCGAKMDLDNEKS